jgi:hypothetical protein
MKLCHTPICTRAAPLFIRAFCFVPFFLTSYFPLPPPSPPTPCHSYHYNVANTRVDQHVEKGNDDGLYISSVACCQELWALIMDAGVCGGWGGGGAAGGGGGGGGGGDAAGVWVGGGVCNWQGWMEQWASADADWGSPVLLAHDNTASTYAHATLCPSVP